MGASPLMSLGMSAMAASYAGMQVTGHNIANANVNGFSRQQLSLTTATGQFTGAGFFGRGVDIQAVTRAHDQFLTREAALARSASAMDATRSARLQQLESVFKLGENGLGGATNKLMDAFADLAIRPGDLATRQVVLARARDLAARFSEAGRSLDQVQDSVASSLRVGVAQINTLTQGIATVNQRITELRGLGQPANDLLDERDRLLSSLSEQVQVTRLQADDGSMSVFIGGGQPLVLGNRATTLQLRQDAEDPSRFGLSMISDDRRLDLDETTLAGGSMTGLLRFQNEDLVAARSLIGVMAASVGAAVNQQQLRGLNLQPPAGSVPSQPMFAIGPALALSHRDNQRDVSGAFVGSVTLAVADATQLQASEYDLRETASGSGAWVLTRLSDGAQTAVSSGDVVDGMRINFGAPPPQPGDSYRLQPVARAADGFAVLLSDPLDIAAASPLMASASPANTGTGAVASLLMSSDSVPTAGATATINFTSDSGDYDWELRDAGGGLISAGSATWSPGGTIPPTGTDINGFALQLSGVPRSGDQFTVFPTPSAALASNNGNAMALQSLRDAAVSAGRTPVDNWSEVLARIGVRVQSAATSATISDAVAGQAETQLAAKSGVNLDEEAARLIQYQQSYQAAAKVLQVAQSLIQQLLDLGR